LYSLEKARFIQRNNKTGEYRLTHKAFQVGRVYIRKVDFHKASMPILKELTAECREASHLGILDEMQVLYLDWVESTYSVSLASLTGRRLPAYCTGVGKNFLAHMDAKDLATYFQNTELIQYTDNTITDPGALTAYLKRVKTQGYAVDNAEYQPEVISVSGPVIDEAGEIVAGISVAGPVFRMGDETQLDKIISLVKKASIEISRQLGWDFKLSLTN
jgi:DNA-binding IclR family transcriptional regulator